MNETTWKLAHGRSIVLGPRAVVMGILNVTPDSFSDGGRFEAVDRALGHANRMMDEGAAIIDIGGESTRPGAQAVDALEEQRRVLPVIEAVAGLPGVLVSVDTYRADTAKLAIEAGAHIVNDVWGLTRDAGMARLAAETGAGLVIMHTGRERDKLPDPVEDQFHFLAGSLRIAREAGVQADQILLDPGFGFGIDADENLELIARFRELAPLDRPFLVGTSRKRFLGTLTGREPEDRAAATAATSVLLRTAGAAIFRVHDVPENRDALAVADAVLDKRARGAEA